jgi:hypothetical protein
MRGYTTSFLAFKILPVHRIDVPLAGLLHCSALISRDCRCAVMMQVYLGSNA